MVQELWDGVRLSQGNGKDIPTWLLQMGMHKEYRRQGIGTALLSQALEEARSRWLERVELDVYASNLATIHLYEKYKFEVEGQKESARELYGSYDDIIDIALLFDA